MSRLHVGVEAWGLGGDLLHTGVGQYARRLLEGLGAEPDVQVTAYAAPGEARPAWLPAAVAWTPVGGRRGRLSAIASRLRELPAQVRADGVDVFHSPGLHVRPSLPPIPDVRCGRVVTIHDLLPLTYYGAALPVRLRTFYRWNLERALRADALVAVSEASRRELLALRPGAPVRVIPNAVEFPPNPDPEPPARLGLRPPYLLYAGSYEPRKNLAGALDAFERLLAAGLPHDLVAIVEAESGHAEPLRRRVAEAPLRGRVRLLHSLAESDLRAVYTSAEALLFPSFGEGFGYPPAQAAACGIPVVASRLPALVEVLGEAALFVDPADAGSIAAGLRRVLDDRSLRARLVAAARGRVAGLTLKAATRRHLEVFDSVRTESEVPA